MAFEPHQCWFAAILATLAGSIRNTGAALRIAWPGECFVAKST